MRQVHGYVSFAVSFEWLHYAQVPCMDQSAYSQDGASSLLLRETHRR